MGGAHSVAISKFRQKSYVSLFSLVLIFLENMSLGPPQKPTAALRHLLKLTRAVTPLPKAGLQSFYSSVFIFDLLYMSVSPRI